MGFDSMIFFFHFQNLFFQILCYIALREQNGMKSDPNGFRQKPFTRNPSFEKPFLSITSRALIFTIFLFRYWFYWKDSLYEMVIADSWYFDIDLY